MENFLQLLIKQNIIYRLKTCKILYLFFDFIYNINHIVFLRGFKMTTETLEKLSKLKESITVLDNEMGDEYDRVDGLRSGWKDFFVFCFSLTAALPLAMMMHAIIAFFLSINLLPLLKPYIDINFYEFIFGMCFIFIMTSIPSTFFLEKMNIKEKNFIDKELTSFHEMKKQLKEKRDEYEKIIFHLETDIFQHMSVADFSLLSKHEKSVLQDYKRLVLESEDGKLFKAFNNSEYNISIKNL